MQQKLADDNPAVTASAATWRTSTSTTAWCCRRRASSRRRRPSSARRWRSSRSWSTTTPPSPGSTKPGVESPLVQRAAVEDGQARGGGGRVAQGGGDPAEDGRRQPRRHRVPQRLAGSHSDARRACCRTRASRRRRRPSTARRWRSGRSWSTTTPPSPSFRSGLAWSHIELANLLSNTGKPAEAEAEYRKAVAIRQKLVDDNPSDIGLRDGLSYDYLRVAALQAWFGQDKELSSTCEKLLSLAKDTEDPAIADKAAKCCSLRQADPKRCETALVLARRAVELGKNHPLLPWFQMALGMAEYRSGHFAEADAALIAAATGGKDNPRVSARQRSTARWACFDRARPNLPASSRPKRPRR